MLAKFEPDFEALNDLSKMFDIMQEQANSFEGTLIIDTDNIKENLENFNTKFETNFSLTTTNEEYQEYFNNEYTNFIQEHLTEKFDYKKHFNDVYLGYAHID